MNELEKKEYQKKYREDNKQKAKEYAKKYYISNKEKICEATKKTYLNNKEKAKEYKKNWYQKNKNNNKEKVKLYREQNKEKTKEYKKIYYLNNKEKVSKSNNKWRIDSNYNSSEYFKNRKKIDSLFKLRINIGNLIAMTLKRKNHYKKSRTHEILGCDYQYFKQHLERQFTKGMTWENQGQWHLDHIYPVSLAKDEQELIRLNHYTNFQPMWAKDNLSKHNKIVPYTQIKFI